MRLALPTWVWLLLLSAAVVSAVEITLLGLGTGFLGAGFNVIALDSTLQRVAFGGISFVFDLGLLLLLWAPLIPFLRRRGRIRLTHYWLLVVFGVGVPCLLAGYRYNIYAILGDMFSVAAARQLLGNSWTALLGEALVEAPIVLLFMLLLLPVAVLLVGSMLGRIDRAQLRWLPQLSLPPARRSLLAGLVITAFCTLVLYWPGPATQRVRYGLEQKTAGLVVSTALQLVTDFDRDGYGPLTSPRDGAPFDAARHPYAREIAGNAIDENGVGGDLPGSLRLPVHGGPARVTHPAEPHVLVIYLETFRQDLIGRVVDGREITPFLNRLAREGASSAHAYAQSAWTSTARSHFLGGDLLPNPGGESLIDDFQQRGYRVSYFSAQDESHGNALEALGVARADDFYHSRMDVHRRTSRSTAPVSLHVSWKLLVSRVREHLASVDPARPNFLYVNIVDAHYPYVHAEMDQILPGPALARERIRSSNVAEVIRGYENAAANVDRAAEQIVTAWRTAIGNADHAIVVLGDHGEAFYEEGLLGHGQSVSAAETRIPFILWGVGGEWPEPIAAADVRSLLLESLALERGSERPRARFVPDPERRVFQFAPTLDRPRYLAWRSLDGALIYDLHTERRLDEARGSEVEAESSGEPDPDLRSLIWHWELQQARVGQSG